MSFLQFAHIPGVPYTGTVTFRVDVDGTEELRSIRVHPTEGVSILRGYPEDQKVRLSRSNHTMHLPTHTT